MTLRITLRPNRKWIEADRQKMVELLSDGVPLEKVARQLKRTEAAVKVQATKSRVSASGNLDQRKIRNESLRSWR